MKPFIVMGVVTLTVPVLALTALVILAFVVVGGLWHARGYWVPRAVYYGITLVAFSLGLLVAVDAIWNPSRHQVSDLLFALTVDVVVSTFLFWWHHQKWIIGDMEFSVFTRRHVQHLGEALTTSV